MATRYDIRKNIMSCKCQMYCNIYSGVDIKPILIPLIYKTSSCHETEICFCNHKSLYTSVFMLWPLFIQNRTFSVVGGLLNGQVHGSSLYFNINLLLQN